MICLFSFTFFPAMGPIFSDGSISTEVIPLTDSSSSSPSASASTELFASLR